MITGTRVNESRKELLKQDERLKVEDALQICRTHEASEAHMHAFEQAGAANANKIDFIGKRRNEKRPNQVTNCKFCAKDHAYGRCPAYYDTCEQCGLVGHWKVRCSQLKKQRTQQQGRNYSKGPDRARSTGRERSASRSRSRSRSRNRKRSEPKKTKVHSIDEEFSKLSFDVITSSRKSSDSDIMVHVDVRIPHLKLPAVLICKVDTGAQGNVLPLRSFKKIFPVS